MKYLYILIISCCFFSFTFADNFPEREDKFIVDDIELKEVVVQASRTQTKLKEMPASVSVLSSAALEANEIHTLNQVTAFVPNFFMPDYGS
ncbi:MAG: TonB-dependent receptor, partial [Paludibacter sp.]|nr:TonB-dependent receptor [Paludibacter sp.]